MQRKDKLERLVRNEKWGDIAKALLDTVEAGELLHELAKLQPSVLSRLAAKRIHALEQTVKQLVPVFFRLDRSLDVSAQPSPPGGATEGYESRVRRMRKLYAQDLRRRTCSVPCPACGQPAGRYCTGRGGQEVVSCHADRSRAAAWAGKINGVGKAARARERGRP